MSMILVTPLSAVTRTVETYKPSHLVSILSEENLPETPAGILTERHLRLALSDITVAIEGRTLPAEAHIEKLLSFGESWTGDSPMLVHCWAGVSRSMAAAYILLCQKLGAGTEYAIARNIRARAAHANPNRLFIRLADNLLEREGRMIDAVTDMGRPKFVEEGVPVEMPLSIMGK